MGKDIFTINTAHNKKIAEYASEKPAHRQSLSRYPSCPGDTVTSNLLQEMESNKLKKYRREKSNRNH